MVTAIPQFASPTFDIEGFDDLVALALDMRWAWNHAADHIWEKIDPDL